MTGALAPWGRFHTATVRRAVALPPEASVLSPMSAIHSVPLLSMARSSGSRAVGS